VPDAIEKEQKRARRDEREGEALALLSRRRDALRYYFSRRRGCSGGYVISTQALSETEGQRDLSATNE